MTSNITIRRKSGGWVFAIKYKGIKQSDISTRRLSTIIEAIENLGD